MLSNKIIAFALLIFAAFFAVQNLVAAQTKKTNALYSAPSRLIFPGDEKEAEEAENADLLREHFYPIGWSKDGKFAFYTEPADEACGCYFGHLVVQDMRTDKIIWEEGYEGNPEKEENLQTYWKQTQKKFSRKLAAYGIVAQKQFALQNAAFSYGKDWLTPDLKDNTASEDGFYVTGNFVLRLISKQKGGKTIYEKNLDAEKDTSFLKADLSGSLLSPFEGRAAIIMSETYRGWEGPPHTRQIRVVGASLIDGFR